LGSTPVEWAEPDNDGIIRRYGASQFELRHVLQRAMADVHGWIDTMEVSEAWTSARP
jgi:hypothetical protein